MKKGLLGLVVIALTIVGCQNYDDQFDDLNKKIATLQTSVNDLDGIQTTIANIMTEIENLKASSASAAELTKVMTEVAALTTSMDEIKAATDYGQDEVDDLETEVDEIKAALNELLEQAAVINQDVVIMSEAQLEYVESLMALDKEADNTVTEDTRVYIVSGNITVDAGFATTDVLATRLNNVLNRVSSVIIPDGGSGVTINSGSSTAGADLSMTSMEFVQGTVTLEGVNAIDVSNLAALTATLTLKQGGDINFPKLNQVGNVRIDPASGTPTITTVVFSNVTTGKVISTADNELIIPALDGDVNLGMLDLPATVTLDKAKSIIAGGAPNGVTISAKLAESISLENTTPFDVTGNVSITAKGAIKLNAKSINGSLNITSTEGSIALNDLTSAGITSLSASTTIHAAITANASGTVASGAGGVHFNSLKSSAASLTITSEDIKLDKLESLTDTVTLNTDESISLPALTGLASNVVADAAKIFVAEKLATATGTINVATGAAITVANLTATTTLEDFDNLLTLTLLEQGDNIDFSAASSMTTLNYTGKKLYSSAPGEQTNQVTITSDVLTELNVDGFIGSLVVSGTAKLDELTTAGEIVNVVLHNNTLLKDVTFGHDHIKGEFAATLAVHHNPSIVELKLNTVNKVKLVNISNNVSLTSLTMAGFDPPAEPSAAISVTIGGNALEATYTAAIAGSETTPYSDASLTDATGLLCSVSKFINFYNDQTDRSATNTPTLSINLAKVSTGTAAAKTLSATLSGDEAAIKGLDGTASNDDDETDGNDIDSIKELNAIVDTCS